MFSCFVKFCPFFWLHGFLFLFVLYCVLFCSYFSNVLCNPLQPPLSQHRVFLLLLPFVCFSLEFLFGLVYLVLFFGSIIWREVLCGPLDSQFYHLNGNVEVGTPHFWTDPNAAWRNQRQGFLWSMNLASVWGLQATRFPKLPLRIPCGFFHQIPSPPHRQSRMGSPQSLHSSDGSR